MSVVRFAADTHFGHKAIAIKRGFKNEFEHDQHIIDEWNKVVHKKDTTYILGDVTMENTQFYYNLDCLNGRKIVVLGNHDMRQHVPELLKYVDQVSGILKYSAKGYPKIFLTHCPIHPRELEYRVKYNIHGHIHEYNVMYQGTTGKNNKPITKQDKRYICVSMEQINYQPKTLKELINE